LHNYALRMFALCVALASAWSIGIAPAAYSHHGPPLKKRDGITLPHRGKRQASKTTLGPRGRDGIARAKSVAYVFDAESCGQLESLWIAEGGNPGLARIMAGIAMAESGGNIYATGDGGASHGLWQIDSDYWPYAPYEPYANARQAVLIERMNGLGAWTTYRDGASSNWC
jgi:lysozyme-like protein